MRKLLGAASRRRYHPLLGDPDFVAVPTSWVAEKAGREFFKMRRREFVTLFNGTAVAWPLAAGAQQGIPMRRIGVLMGFAEDEPESKARLAGFRRAQKAWMVGGSQCPHRLSLCGRQIDQFQALAKELVALQPDVILAQGTANTAAVQRESPTIQSCS